MKNHLLVKSSRALQMSKTQKNLWKTTSYKHVVSHLFTIFVHTCSPYVSHHIFPMFVHMFPICFPYVSSYSYFTIIFHIFPIWVFPKIWVPQNGLSIMENPIKMDDLGVPLFSETSISFPISLFFCSPRAKRRSASLERPRSDFWVAQGRPLAPPRHPLDQRSSGREPAGDFGRRKDLLVEIFEDWIL